MSRVLLDLRELAELDERVNFTEERVRAIRRLLEELRPGLQLGNRAAPDEARSAQLTAALDRCTALLAPLATALGHDQGYVVEVRRRAQKADGDGPRRRLPREDVERLLDGLTGTGSPAQLAVLEALLLGGLRRTATRQPRTPGAPRTPQPTRTDASAAVRAVVRIAKSQVGVAEGGVNRTRYGRWYGMDGVAWCAIFVSWVFAKAGHRLPALQGPKGFAEVRAGAEALRRRGKLHRTPRVGDIWLHRGPTWQQDHTGIVVAVHGDGSFTTVEGNASDAVRQRRHGRGEIRSSYGFGRVL